METFPSSRKARYAGSSSNRNHPREENKRALLEMFDTLFDLLDHIANMRTSMQRMEIYLLIMVIIIGTLVLVGFLGGVGYLCMISGQSSSERHRSAMIGSGQGHPGTTIMNEGQTIGAPPQSIPPGSRTVIKQMPGDAKL